MTYLPLFDILKSQFFKFYKNKNSFIKKTIALSRYF